MKTPAEAKTQVAAWLTRNLAVAIVSHTIDGSYGCDEPEGASAPRAITLLGQTNKGRLQGEWETRYYPWARDWFARSLPAGVTVRDGIRRVGVSDQTLPTHLDFESVAAMCGFAGPPWPALLTTLTDRWKTLTATFPATADVRVLRRTADWGDVDFDLLITVSEWFSDHHHNVAGLTPRQVPIPGVHAKWLQGRQAQVLTLVGLDDLGLLPPHPPRIHFTYLDPAYRASGARLHDSATVGDNFTPPYDPTVIVISENKDTAIHFPALPGGIAVEGDGFAGKVAAAFPWIAAAPRLFYWGDIDKYGYEILNGYREVGLPVTSILMNAATYDAYEPYGTDLDKNARPIERDKPKAVEELEPGERAVYERLHDPAHRGHLRIEQERIPLDVALAAIRATSHPFDVPRPVRAVP